tara:strand:- start:713 stop:934 length:222 start_codon:yes stop_codon:yes gene_type:complete
MGEIIKFPIQKSEDGGLECPYGCLENPDLGWRCEHWCAKHGYNCMYEEFKITNEMPQCGCSPVGKKFFPKRYQ